MKRIHRKPLWIRQVTAIEWGLILSGIIVFAFAIICNFGPQLADTWQIVRHALCVPR